MTNYDMQNLNLYGMNSMQRKKPNMYEQEKILRQKKTRELYVLNSAA